MAKMTFRSNDHLPEEGEWKTFKEWQELGYGVIKGERARRYIRGVAVFHESQVRYIDRELYEFLCDELGAYNGPEWWKD